MVLEKTLRRREPVHVFAVHGVTAITGSLLFPFFVLPVFGGPGYDDGVNVIAQLGAQVVGIGATVVWTAVMTIIIALMVAMVIPMQASEEQV